MSSIQNVSLYQNVTNHERVFRAVIGMIVLAAVSAGLFTSPAVIFSVSMIMVYQVFTAILGIDPMYTIANALSRSRNVTGGELVNA